MTDDSRRARKLRKGELALHALGRHKGNAKEAAKDQGVAVRTLHARIFEYCRLMGYDTPIEAAYWMRPEPKLGEIGTFST